MTELEVLQLILDQAEAGNALLERVATSAVAVSHLAHLFAGFCLWSWTANQMLLRRGFEGRL